jgi:hypothetical protein
MSANQGDLPIGFQNRFHPWFAIDILWLSKGKASFRTVKFQLLYDKAEFSEIRRRVHKVNFESDERTF